MRHHHRRQSHTSQSWSDAGQEMRTRLDRRVNNWIAVNAFLFDASFAGGADIEGWAKPEFAITEAARVETLKCSEGIGRLPQFPRKDVQSVWIHQVRQPFGGGPHNLLIHIEQALGEHRN